MTDLHDHEYAALFPLMTDEELGRLSDDIHENGIREAVVLLGGKILDGRNRYRACLRAGVTPRIEDYAGNDPLGFVISKNLHRRHLSESQRAMVAGRLASMKGGERTDLASIDARSDAQAADILNVSEPSVERAKKVQRDGVPELSKAVDDGEVSVSAAAEVAKLPKTEQKKVVEQGPAAVKEKAKQQREKKKQSRSSTPVSGRTHPSGNASDEQRRTPEHDEGDGEGKESEGGTEAANPSEGSPTKVIPPPAVDGWGIPIQEHAEKAFEAAPDFDHAIRLLREAQRLLTPLADSPGGWHLMRKSQFIKTGSKAGGRWSLAFLDNAIATLEDAKPRYTDCPYAFNPDREHDDKCPLCQGKRFTGNLKGHQIPPTLTRLMKEHYGIAEGE